ncbi:S8 family peptidase [Saccharothrix syringae]|uniref:Peptidase S8 n=1 Tax=Saccharothrix syringae TaxID=103733 RepID=A0A5Q0GQP3_SACSY|nr:S8 family serine peptidase [Saccharothrix syringae]QFZ16416.1 peptidase S8 [Saccharothrix syringae]
MREDAMNHRRPVWAPAATAALLVSLVAGQAAAPGAPAALGAGSTPGGGVAGPIASVVGSGRAGAGPAALGPVVSAAHPAGALPLPPNHDRTRPRRGDEPPAERVDPALTRATGPVTAFVELATTPAAEAYGDQKARGAVDPAAAARAARRRTEDVADRVLAALRHRDAGTREVATTGNAVPGVLVTADAARLRELAALPEVRAIRRTVPKVLHNASAAQLTGVDRVWRDTGHRGEGMRIGVVDTGIDYTHADFGGPGTTAAHDAVDRTAPWTPTAKVVGGHDFAGDDYDANDPVRATPAPDPNPMDCQGHGTHVAGTAAGYGTNADGTAFTGDYGALTPEALNGMGIGPGVAPAAQLYALKIFGCSGATALVGQALDWSLDPNGDGDFGDRLDVVNLSLGGDYGGQDDPDSLFVRKVVEHGVVVVASAGNGGDSYDVGGSPANTPEALAVANTRDAFMLLDGVEADGARRSGQYSVGYPGYDALDLELPVVPVADQANADGCAPITQDLTDRFVWLEWDEDDATRECGSAPRTDNAQAAGARGVLLPADGDVFKAAIAGNAGIPVFQLTGTDSRAVRPALEAGTLRVRMTGALRNAAPTTIPDLADTVTPSSSRGSRGPVAAKPDVAAPGDTILSAAAGTGTGAVSLGGTSMAAPHVAGIAALVRQAHPDRSVEEVKAAIVNTATHDVTDGDDRTTGTREAPMRVGAGRVDAVDAVAADVLAMAAGDAGAVGISFGPVGVAGEEELTRPLEVVNKSAAWRTARLSYEPVTQVPGASFEVWPPVVVVPPGQSRAVDVRLRLVPGELRKVADPTVEKLQAGVARQFLAEASGLVVVRAGGPALRVPVYAAPKPVADVEAVLDGGVLRLGGRALDQGEGDEAYRSLMTAFELQGTSPELPACTEEVEVGCAVNESARGGDLRYVGAASDGTTVAFGVATWRDWVTLGSVNSPWIRIDTDADGAHDYVVEAVKPTNAAGVVTSDVWLARTTRVADGAVVDEQPLNGQYGDVDTNVMDSDVVVLPVLLSALGIDAGAGSARLTYTAGVSGLYPAPGDPEGFVDHVAEPMSFDPLHPGIGLRGGWSFTARVGDEVEVVRDPASAAVDRAGGLLVLHHHNASGDRVQVVG